MISSPIRAVAHLLLAGLAIGAPGTVFAQSAEVNVYSYREAKLAQSLLEPFTQATGI